MGREFIGSAAAYVYDANNYPNSFMTFGLQGGLDRSPLFERRHGTYGTVGTSLTDSIVTINDVPIHEIAS